MIGDLRRLAISLLLLATIPAWAQGGAALLQKAEALDRANQFEAAQAAYAQARAAFSRAGDFNGQQKALTELAALDERLADQLMQPAPAAPTAPAVAAVRTAAPRATAPGQAAPTLPLAGSVAGGRPVGLFFMSRYLMALHSLEKATYYFTPGGQVYVNPTGFSTAELATLPASSRGSYTLSGKQLVVRWVSGGQPETDVMELQATTFAWDMGLFLAVQPFARAQVLLGAFEGGSSVSLGGGSTAVVSSLTFRPDGTYSYGGSSALASSGGGSTARAGASREGTGRWSLSGWLLTLTNAAGQTQRGVAYPIEINEKTGQLTRFYFGSVAYKRL